jgi:hypothetical protein
MKCFSLLLGARNVGKGGWRFSPRDEAQIRAITARHFPEGFTILAAAGGWFDPRRRRFIHESSREILVCAAGRSRLRSWCAELGAALQQRELLVVELGPAFTFRIRRGAPGNRRS